jgi:aspartate/methionine/tyrosine aminotransferase
VSIASLPGMAERTLSVYTFSKSYAMTGWRLGYVVSPRELRPAMGPLLGFYTTHGVFPAVQTAGRVAVTGPQDAVERMRAAYQERRDLLIAGLEGQGAIRVPAPRGAFYAFADVSVARAGRDIWDLVREWLALGVAVLPGTAFGPGYDDWVRMSLATKRDDIVEAARRLREHVMAAPSAR